ncbi:hypothetical protein DJ50_4689 [Bacillus cereus ATCC 10876]|nr:hypothetical protein DJ50_4689 [Bacillus cereus ATCC 10876]
MRLSHKSIVGVWKHRHQANKTEIPQNGNISVLYFQHNFILLEKNTFLKLMVIW